MKVSLIRVLITFYVLWIVGAGSAGCLVANRLSRHYNVLLLEAGGEPNPMQFVPGFAFFMLNYPEVDWMVSFTEYINN